MTSNTKTPPYLLTAYGIWLKHGHTGTEDDFLNSLKGDKGDTPLLQFDAETGYLQYRYSEDEEWTNIASLEDLMTEGEAAVIASAKNYSDLAEAYAKGTVDGDDVPSGDPGYHDNAKYYAGQAESQATAAANHANNAESSTQAAIQAAYNAATSAAAAQDSAVSASESSYNAASSASNAALSAGSSATSAQTAQTQAGLAATHASDAYQHSQTAVNYAQAAQTYASNAATYASSAATSAENVSAYVTAAAAAQTAAEAAQTAAETAETHAETAQDKAEDAQEAAEAAQAAAEAVLESIPEDYSELSSDVTDLKSAIDERTGTQEIIVDDSGYIATNGQTVDVNTVVTNVQFIHGVVDCTAGDRFTITGSGGSTPRVWCFVAQDGTSLSVAANGATPDNALIVAPSNATKLVVNFVKAQEHALYKGVFGGQIATDVYPFMDARATLYPTGDTTARQTDILAMVTKYGACYFAPGDYYISAALTLPDNVRLYGAGKKSHIIMSSSATGQMINVGANNQIGNLWFDGGLTDKPADTSTNRHGIRVQNNNNTLQMHDCWITGFGGSGVRVSNAGYRDLTSVEIVNCCFACCGYGIYFLEHGEYGVVSNCTFIDNATGLYVQGGNNIVSGCAIERNTYGATVSGDNVDNSGHGAFIGCSFNHNTDTGLTILKTTNGYVVSGCQFFRNDSKEFATNSSGVNVCGCNFGASTKLSFSGDCVTAFTGNMFVGTPTVSYTGNAITIDNGNSSFNGSKITILRPGTIGNWDTEELKRYNASNIIVPQNISTTVINDIAYKAENGVYTLVSGTASAFTAINIGDTISVMPDGFAVGDRVYAHFRDTAIPGVTFQIVLYNTSTVVFETTTDGWFAMPDLSVPLRVRITVVSGTTLTGETATPYLGKAPTNGMIGRRLYQNDMPPMLTIIDDDAHVDFYNDVLPIIQSENVPIASAVPIVSVGTTNHMTWEQIAECNDAGAEILSHTYSHQTTYPEEWTEQQIEQDYQKARNILARRGMADGKYLVYSGTTGEDDRAKQAAPMVYDLAINSAGNSINHLDSINPYRIKRYRIETDTYNYDLTALKALIDTVLQEGGWMVWMFHTSDSTWTTTAETNLTAAITYAKAQGLPIVTVNHVYNTYIKKAI